MDITLNVKYTGWSQMDIALNAKYTGWSQMDTTLKNGIYLMVTSIRNANRILCSKLQKNEPLKQSHEYNVETNQS